MGHRCHALTVPEDISAQNLKVFFVLWELSGDSLKYQYYIYFIIIMRTLFSIGNQASCTLCPAGYACPSIFTNVMVACEIGYYSPVGSSVCLQCPSVRHTILLYIILCQTRASIHNILVLYYNHREICVQRRHRCPSFAPQVLTLQGLNNLVHYVLPVSSVPLTV
jgi:hypothetical protein